MTFGQVMTLFKVNPDPDSHFGFLCEHGAWCQKQLYSMFKSITGGPFRYMHVHFAIVMFYLFA